MPLKIWKKNLLPLENKKSSIGEDYSKCIDVTIGVPQGSVQGPVLFLALHKWLPKRPLIWCGNVRGRRENLEDN